MKYEIPEMEVMWIDSYVSVMQASGEAGPGEGGGTVTPGENPEEEWT